jgi:hypothetical protein
MQNPNSPERLLGRFLSRSSTRYIDVSRRISGKDAKQHLAHMLSFSYQYGKMPEMYRWLISPSGKAFLSKPEYQPFGELINNELSIITGQYKEERFIKKINQDAMAKDMAITQENLARIALQSALIEWVNKYQRVIPFAIQLNG